MFRTGPGLAQAPGRFLPARGYSLEKRSPGWLPLGSSARVDVPVQQRRFSSSSMVPPRARGCSQKLTIPIATSAGSSPRAWMFRRAATDRDNPCGFLPARGDVPISRSVGAKWEEVPPRARGCSVLVNDQEPLPFGSSPRAGMFPRRWAACATARRFLPAREDVPPRSPSARRAGRVPPRARGCSRRASLAVVFAWGSSPRAGMFPQRVADAPARTRFLPARGDVPVGRLVKTHMVLVPPRARGCSGIDVVIKRDLHGSSLRAWMFPL